MDQEIKILIKTAFDGSGSKEAIAAQEELNRLAKQGNQEAARALELQRQRAQERPVGGQVDQGKLAEIRATSEWLRQQSPEAEAKREQLRRQAVDARAKREREQEQSSLADQMGGFREESERRRAKDEQDRIAAQQQAIYSNQERQRKEEDAAYRKQVARDAAARGVPHLDQEQGGGEGGGGISLGQGARAFARSGGLGTAGYLMAGGGMVAGIAAVGLATREVAKNISELYEKLNQLAEASRHFDTAAGRAESYGNEVRKLIDHHRDLALSYAEIERQVRTVSAEVAHRLQLGEAEIQFDQRKDDAETELAMERVRRATMFNPIERIRQEEEVEEAAFHRRMDRERQLEQIKINALKLEQTFSAEREKTYQGKVDELDKTIPGLQREADIDKQRVESVAKGGELRRAELEKERALVQELALGKGGIETLTKYQTYRMFAPQELNQSSAASDSLFTALRPQSEATVAAANERLKELDEAIGGVDEDNRRARAVARQSEARVGRAERQRGMYEQEVQTSKTEQEKAQFQQEQAEALQKQNELRRDAEEAAKTEAMRERSTRQQMESMGPVQLGPNTTFFENGGESPIDVIKEMRDEMKELNRKWEGAA